jgi:hypothetical protein
MSDLIEALTIFLKYANPRNPTHCEHDVMSIMEVDLDDMTAEDIARVEALGFTWDDDNDVWISFRYGSA